MFIAHQQSVWRIWRFVYALERVALMHLIEHGPITGIRINCDTALGHPFPTFR